MRRLTLGDLLQLTLIVCACFGVPTSCWSQSNLNGLQVPIKDVAGMRPDRSGNLLLWGGASKAEVCVFEAASGAFSEIAQAESEIVTAGLSERRIVLVTRRSDRRLQLIVWDANSLEQVAEKTLIERIESPAIEVFGDRIEVSAPFHYRQQLKYFSLPDLKAIDGATLDAGNAEIPSNSSAKNFIHLGASNEPASNPEISIKSRYEPAYLNLRFGPEPKRLLSTSSGTSSVRYELISVGTPRQGTAAIDLVASHDNEEVKRLRLMSEISDPTLVSEKALLLARAENWWLLLDDHLFRGAVADFAAELSSSEGPSIHYVPFTAKALVALPGSRHFGASWSIDGIAKLNAGEHSLVKLSSEAFGRLQINCLRLFAATRIELVEKLLSDAGNQDTDRVLRNYHQKVQPEFARVFGRDPVGVPVTFEISHQSHGKGSEPVRYKCLTEFPTTEVRYAVASELSRKFGSQPQGESARRMLRVLDPSLPTAGMLDLNASAAVMQSQSEIDKPSSTQRLKQALARVDSSTSSSGQLSQQARNWTVNGQRLRGRVESLFAGNVVLALDDNRYESFPIEDFDSADIALLKNAVGAKQRRDTSTAKKLKVIANAFQTYRFQNRNRFPPSALVTAEGQRKLSWRVLILPWIGGQELFTHFHLDEPWDSEHNLKLLQYMPDVYRVGGEAHSIGHTQLVRFAGPDTVAPDLRLVTGDDISRLEKTLLATVVNAQAAVPWTKPADFRVGVESEISDFLWSLDDRVLVLTCDGKTHWINSDHNDASWQAFSRRLN